MAKQPLVCAAVAATSLGQVDSQWLVKKMGPSSHTLNAGPTIEGCVPVGRAHVPSTRPAGLLDGGTMCKHTNCMEHHREIHRIAVDFGKLGENEHEPGQANS